MFLVCAAGVDALMDVFTVCSYAPDGQKLLLIEEKNIVWIKSGRCYVNNLFTDEFYSSQNLGMLPHDHHQCFVCCVMNPLTSLKIKRVGSGVPERGQLLT